MPDDYSQLTVTKHWINSDGTAAKPGASSVKVDLYRVTKKLNAVKVKVKVVDVNNQTKFEKNVQSRKAAPSQLIGGNTAWKAKALTGSMSMVSRKLCQD